MIDFCISVILIMINFISYRRSMGMYRFCHRMAVSGRYRKHYAQSLVLLLIAYYAMKGLQFIDNGIGYLLMMTVMVFLFINPGYVMALLRTSRRHLFLVILMALASIITALFTNLICISITLAVIITGSVLYPSDKVMASLNSSRQFLTPTHLLDSFFDDYFQ